MEFRRQDVARGHSISNAYLKYLSIAAMLVPGFELGTIKIEDVFPN